MLILPCSALKGTKDPGIELLRNILINKYAAESYKGDGGAPQDFREKIGKPRVGMFPLTSKKFWLENEEVFNLLPKSPPLYATPNHQSKGEENNGDDGEVYDDDVAITDRNDRFFVSEIIRGVLFDVLDKELPYCTQVLIQSFSTNDNGEEGEPVLTTATTTTNIKADIIVERESQKKICIGKNGSMIKKIGIESRKRIVDFLHMGGSEDEDDEKHKKTKVFLDLNIKVEKDWRRNEDRLIEYGYDLASASDEKTTKKKNTNNRNSVKQSKRSSKGGSGKKNKKKKKRSN